MPSLELTRPRTSARQLTLALLATNLKACWADRGAFLLQMAFMMLNNLIFAAVWFIFFAQFEEVRGWRLPELLCLYGTAALAFGVSVILSGGVRELARMIVDGDLDSCLVQPYHPLLSVTLARTYASGWGDLVSGLILIGISGLLGFWELPLLIVFALAGAAIFTATAVIAQSLAFWFGSIQEAARQSTIFLVTFSVYPQTIFTGYWKVLLFTAIPSGFIAYLPVTLYRDPDPWLVLAVVGAAAGYAAIAYVVFERGLRRYESGNRIGRGG